MKKLQFLKADDYMKTITSSLNSNLSAVNLAVSFIAASCPVKSSTNVELSYYNRVGEDSSCTLNDLYGTGKKQHKRANSFCYFSNNLFYIHIFYLLVKSRIILFLLLSMLTRKSINIGTRNHLMCMIRIIFKINPCIIKIITA